MYQTSHIGDEGGIPMSAVFGTVTEFVEGVEEWPQYVDRLEQFFAANGIEVEGKKRSILLSVVGARTYQLLTSLVAPDKPGSKTYDELKNIMEQHLSPPPSEIVQRYRFHTCVRREGEPVAGYVCRLREVARRCNFGQALSEMLRDRLVCGVNDGRIQKKVAVGSKTDVRGSVENCTSARGSGKMFERNLGEESGYCAYGEEKRSGFDGAMFSLWES